MVENQMPQKEITVLELFRVLAKKVKLIAWITLLAIVLGAAAGLALALVANATYGAQVEFYISSEEANSYILSLVRSDSFAERLLLDENGLPETDKGTKAYNDALAAKLAVDAKREEMEELEKAVKLYPSKKDKAQRAYNDAKLTYDSLKDSWEIYMGVQDSELLDDSDHKEIDNLKKALAEAELALKKENEAYKAIQDEMQDADSALLVAQDELKSLISEKNVLYNIALKEFRNNPDNIALMKDVKKCVTFDIDKTEKDNKINESSAQLHVNIEVMFDEALAQNLLDKIANNLPPFVEESVIAEAEERETECEYLSVFASADVVEYKNPAIEALKFGAIAAVIALMVTCFVVILTEIVKSADAAKLAAPAEQPAIEKADEEEKED